MQSSEGWPNWGGWARDRQRSILTSRSEQLAALTLRHAVPTIYQYREFAVAGGLQSYGADVADTYRVAAQQAATRLLRSQPDFRVTHAEEAFPTRSRSSAIE